MKRRRRRRRRNGIEVWEAKSWHCVWLFFFFFFFFFFSWFRVWTVLSRGERENQPLRNRERKSAQLRELYFSLSLCILMALLPYCVVLCCFSLLLSVAFTVHLFFSLWSCGLKLLKSPYFCSCYYENAIAQVKKVLNCEKKSGVPNCYLINCSFTYLINR